MSWSGDWGRRPDGLTTALRAAVRSPDHVVATYYAVTAMRSIVNTSMRSPTWSPAPYNEIAYAARTGPGNDIKIRDLATGQVRQLTFGEGTNESPAFAPNGRHLAFMSTRSGKSQIFTIARDGRDLKQVTRTGNNYQPDWSK